MWPNIAIALLGCLSLALQAQASLELNYLIGSVIALIELPVVSTPLLQSIPDDIIVHKPFPTTEIPTTTLVIEALTAGPRPLPAQSAYYSSIHEPQSVSTGYFGLIYVTLDVPQSCNMLPLFMSGWPRAVKLPRLNHVIHNLTIFSWRHLHTAQPETGSGMEQIDYRAPLIIDVPQRLTEHVMLKISTWYGTMMVSHTISSFLESVRAVYEWSLRIYTRILHSKAFNFALMALPSAGGYTSLLVWVEKGKFHGREDSWLRSITNLIQAVVYLFFLLTCLLFCSTLDIIAMLVEAIRKIELKKLWANLLTAIGWFKCRIVPALPGWVWCSIPIAFYVAVFFYCLTLTVIRVWHSMTVVVKLGCAVLALVLAILFLWYQGNIKDAHLHRISAASAHSYRGSRKSIVRFQTRCLTAKVTPRFNQLRNTTTSTLITEHHSDCIGQAITPICNASYHYQATSNPRYGGYSARAHSMSYGPHQQCKSPFSSRAGPQLVPPPLLREQLRWPPKWSYSQKCILLRASRARKGPLLSDAQSVAPTSPKLYIIDKMPSEVPDSIREHIPKLHQDSEPVPRKPYQLIHLPFDPSYASEVARRYGALFQPVLWNPGDFVPGYQGTWNEIGKGLPDCGPLWDRPVEGRPSSYKSSSQAMADMSAILQYLQNGSVYQQVPQSYVHTRIPTNNNRCLNFTNKISGNTLTQVPCAFNRGWSSAGPSLFVHDNTDTGPLLQQPNQSLGSRWDAPGAHSDLPGHVYPSDPEPTSLPNPTAPFPTNQNFANVSSRGPGEVSKSSPVPAQISSAASGYHVLMVRGLLPGEYQSWLTLNSIVKPVSTKFVHTVAGDHHQFMFSKRQDAEKLCQLATMQRLQATIREEDKNAGQGSQPRIQPITAVKERLRRANQEVTILKEPESAKQEELQFVTTTSSYTQVAVRPFDSNGKDIEDALAWVAELTNDKQATACDFEYDNGECIAVFSFDPKNDSTATQFKFAVNAAAATAATTAAAKSPGPHPRASFREPPPAAPAKIPAAMPITAPLQSPQPWVVKISNIDENNEQMQIRRIRSQIRKVNKEMAQPVLSGRDGENGSITMTLSFKQKSTAIAAMVRLDDHEYEGYTWSATILPQ